MITFAYEKEAGSKLNRLRTSRAREKSLRLKCASVWTLAMMYVCVRRRFCIFLFFFSGKNIGYPDFPAFRICGKLNLFKSIFENLQLEYFIIHSWYMVIGWHNFFTDFLKKLLYLFTVLSNFNQDYWAFFCPFFISFIDKFSIMKIRNMIT